MYGPTMAWAFLASTRTASPTRFGRGEKGHIRRRPPCSDPAPRLDPAHPQLHPQAQSHAHDPFQTRELQTISSADPLKSHPCNHWPRSLANHRGNHGYTILPSSFSILSILRCFEYTAISTIARSLGEQTQTAATAAYTTHPTSG